MLRDMDTKISDLNSQITKLDGIRKNIERLQKQLDDQLNIADEMTSTDKQKKEKQTAPNEDMAEPVGNTVLSGGRLDDIFGQEP